MDKAGFSEKPQSTEISSGEDIPAALRDTPIATTQARRSKPLLLIGGLVGVGILALSAGIFFGTATAPKVATAPSNTTQTPNNVTSNTPNPRSDQLLGHLTYPEAPLSELAPISTDRRIQMRSTAAKQFKAMVAAARANGVSLAPISGFRSIKDQEQLFFDVKSARNQTASERAAVSAPPGYSEHHTGYAVDIGDGTVPATNLNPNFDKTKAYEWVNTNAARFSFEMSFPKDNPQGVSYEPWHWRYVGDTPSLETFYRAKNLKPQLK